MNVIPTGTALGAELRGVDLRRLDDRSFAAIHRAWLDNLVLPFRSQSLHHAPARSLRPGDPPHHASHPDQG